MSASPSVLIQGKATWVFERDHESDTWVAVCPALNLNACGDTFQEAQEMANEAIQLLFQSLFEADELEAFLRRNGWTVQSPLPARNGRPFFDLPYAVEFGSVAHAHA